MKMLKFMPVLSLAAAVIMSVAGVSVLGAPVRTQPAVVTAKAIDNTADAALADAAPAEGTHVVGVTDTEDDRPQYDTEAIYRVLMLNRVFDEYLYSDEALVEEAQIILIHQATMVDGVLSIRRDTVNNFIRALYGREVVNSSDSEYYAVAARGYDPIGHEITDISVANGIVTVKSVMRVGGNMCVNAVTTLAPSQNEYGYIVLSAEVVE